jgi:hypothetical protein
MDVFISYSNKDKKVAESLCYFLEEQNIRCWIAPRDIPAGYDYAPEIVRAIRGCAFCIIVFSNNTNTSKHVINETEIAFEEEKRIIPFRIEDAQLNDAFFYYLKKTQWIDAFPNPEEKFILLKQQLSDAIKTTEKNRTQVTNQPTKVLIESQDQYQLEKELEETPEDTSSKKSPKTEKSKLALITTDNEINNKKLRGQRLNGKYGFIDENNKVVIPFQYDYAHRRFEEGLAVIGNNGKYGFMNEAGEIVIPLKYEFASSFRNGRAKIKKGGKYGFIDSTEKVIIPIKYEAINESRNSLMAVKKNGKWGFINKIGNLVIPCQYEETGAFSEGFAAVRREYKWGFIDEKNNTIIPFKYDDASGFSEGLAAVAVNNKREGKLWGYMDTKGEIIIPFKYSRANYFSDGKARVLRVERWFGFQGEIVNYYIDKKGKRISKKLKRPKTLHRKDYPF